MTTLLEDLCAAARSQQEPPSAPPFRFFSDLEVSERRDAQENGRFMSLQGKVVSEEGVALTAYLLDQIVLPFIRSNLTSRLTAGSELKVHVALGSILADLIHSARQGRAAYRGVRNESFSPPCPVARTAFHRAMDALVAEALVDVRKGHRVKSEGFGGDRDVASLFQATPKLLSLAEHYGVSVGSGSEAHFTHGHRSADHELLGVVARAKRNIGEDGKKSPVQEMPLDLSDPQTRAVADRMKLLNDFLLEPGRVEGFAFGGLRRIFSNADQPGFQWQWGGRLHTPPGWDPYESWKGGSSRRRQLIRLEGEEVVEADISATFLSILYGLLGELPDLTKAPYEVGRGVSRDRAKAWCTMALRTFSTSAGGRPFNRVRTAFLERHPILERMETCGFSNADLQYHESEIILTAVEAMRDQHDVAALPVHDCLVVPRSQAGAGQEVLKKAFHDHLRDVAGSAHPFFPIVNLK